MKKCIARAQVKYLHVMFGLITKSILPKSSLFFILFFCSSVMAQTDLDAIMMAKGEFCGGLMFKRSTWTDYWEGTFKRDNRNIGRFTSQMTGLMGNYGAGKKINLLFGVPYSSNRVSGGTLAGKQGIQDLSLFVKYMPVETPLGRGTFSLYTIGGLSFPLGNYVADFLPLSIGLRSRTATLRLMTDYQIGNWFATLSGSYVFRDNIRIDRNAYYTTEMHYTNEVFMPNVFSANFRTGYRSGKLIAELVVDNWTTLGGFDIRKNDMPFPSNRMEMTRVGLNSKYTFSKPASLSVIAGGDYVVSGRNMGQATAFHGGVFYIIDLKPKQKKK
jgi:hypothetical protein